MPDPIEIAQGSDPNCAKDKPCAQPLDLVAQSSTSSQDFQDLLKSTQTTLGAAQAFFNAYASGTTGAQ